MLHGTITIEATRVVSVHGHSFEKSPKTDAGRRTLNVPENILADLKSPHEQIRTAEPRRSHCWSEGVAVR